MNQPVIDVQNLTRTFKVKKKQNNFFRDFFRPQFSQVIAVDNVTFKINKGESVAFLGPNGAGKTTTTKMLTGLIYPSSGSISVLNHTPFHRKKEFLMQIGLVMGNKAGLNWDLTPRQSFDLFRQIYRIPEEAYKERIAQLTELLDTESFLDTQVRKLSLGERMKMEIIGAILHAPQILFLDEPTIGLDIISKQRIRHFLRQIQKEYNITILLTSHDMDDVEKVCDRVIVINKGKKVYDNDLEKLTKEYQQFKYVRFTFDTKPSLDQIPNYVNEITSEDEQSITYKIDNNELSKIITDLSNQFGIKDIDMVSTPLEEIIRDIFEQAGT